MMLRGGLERGEGFPRSRERSYEWLVDLATSFAIAVVLAFVLVVGTWLI